MDLGGVTKEFFHLVSEQMLDPRANLFIPQGPNNTFHPSPSSAINGTPLAPLFLQAPRFRASLSLSHVLETCSRAFMSGQLTRWPGWHFFSPQRG